MPVASAPAARGANPSCTPGYVQNDQIERFRTYSFINTGTCDWVVPASVKVQAILIVSGGGGGGGGSYGGSVGGGGGGGGGGGSEEITEWNIFKPGDVITVTVGAGGAGGAGAAALNGTGSAGGNGGASKFGPYEVPGGIGGGGALIDVGGSGGASPYDSGSFVYGYGAGGGQYAGNGGSGASQHVSGQQATAYSGGSYRIGDILEPSYYQYPSITYTSRSGAGGAAGGASSTGGGTSSTSPDSPSSNSGGGGGGGHGCPATESPCTNRTGGNGASGMILISTYFSFTQGELPETVPGEASDEYSLRLVVGIPQSFKIFSNPEPIGSASWSISPALPAGFSFNSSTGVLTGTPTSAANQVTYVVSYTDSLSTINSTITIFHRRARNTLSVSNQTLSFGRSFRIPVEQLKGTGNLSITSSNNNLCKLSGSKFETITAYGSSGTCTITIDKYVDSAYLSYNSTFAINLTKFSPGLTLTTNLSSPQVAGTTIRLTATTSGIATGNVDFYLGDTLISECGSNGRVSLTSSVAICDWTPAVAASSSVDLNVRYVETTNYSAVKSNVIAYLIRPDISLGYQNSESTYGNAAEIAPLVSGGTGSITSWTWSVARTSNQQLVSGISINSRGEISIASNLASGTYPMTVTAIDTVGISKTAVLTIKVNAATPVVSLINPSRTEYTKGQNIRLRASLPSDATGSVVFKYGATTISTCGTSGNVTISGGDASCSFSTSGLAAGVYSFFATYSGGGSYSSASSFTYDVRINPKAEFTYQNQSTTYKVSTSLQPTIASNSGTGLPSSWSWSVVNSTDFLTVSGITISTSGQILVDDTVGAGNYSLLVSAVDLAGDTSTATTTLTINKATPTLTLAARLVNLAIVNEATAGNQVAWTVVSSHNSAGAIKIYIDNNAINCSSGIQWGPAQCWWSSSSGGTRISAFATFAGDSNLESATSNVIASFAINPALSLSYSDTSTYVGFPTTLMPITSGGSGTKNFIMSQYFTGDQIPGITIDSSTGVISVASNTRVGVYRMVIIVRDGVNASVQDDNVVISILSHAAPSITLSKSSDSIETDVELTGYEVINASTPGIYYTIAPSLPSGLSFDSSKGRISGKLSSPLSTTNYVITAFNMAGSDSATYTLTVTEPTIATVSISVGTSPAQKGVANTIVATISAAGRVQFFVDGKRIPGCVSINATTSATCPWKPSRIGSFAIRATLKPTNQSIASASSGTVQVPVVRRTGFR